MLERLFQTLASRGLENHLLASQKALLFLADGGLIIMELEPRLKELDKSDMVNIVARLRERRVSPTLYGEEKDDNRTRAISEYVLRDAVSKEKFINVVSNIGAATKRIGDGQSHYMRRENTLKVMADDFWIPGDLWAMTFGGDWTLATADLRPLALWWRVLLQHFLNYIPDSMSIKPRVHSLTNGLFDARDALIRLARARADMLLEEGKRGSTITILK